jgi:hypothetical protein
MALLGAFFFGFVPMFLFAAFVNWLDRYEKEPKLLLGAAFVLGCGHCRRRRVHPEHRIRHRHLRADRLGQARRNSAPPPSSRRSSRRR